MKSKKSLKKSKNSRMAIIKRGVIKARKPRGVLNSKLDRIKRKAIVADSMKFTLNLPRSIHIDFKNKCWSEGTLMSDIVRAMIMNYIK